MKLKNFKSINKVHFAKTHVLDDITFGESTFFFKMLKSLLGVSRNGVCIYKKYNNVLQLLPAFLDPQKKFLKVCLFLSMPSLFFAPCNVLVLNSYRLFGSYSYFSARFYSGENSIFLAI